MGKRGPKPNGYVAPLVAETTPVYCAICGQRQRSKALWNHRDMQGDPCVSYARRKAEA